MAGLFGASAAQVSQAVGQEQRELESRQFSRDAAALSQIGGAAFAGLTAGGIFGRAISRASGSSAEDPRVARAQKLDQIKLQIQATGLQPGSPEHTQEVVRLLAEAGEPDLAMQAMKQGQAMQAQLAKTDLAEARAEDLRNPPPAKQPTSFQEFQLAQKDPAFDKFLKRKQAASGTNVNVNTGQGRLGRLLSPEEKAAAGIPSQSVVQVGKDGKLSVVDEVPGEQRARLAALKQASSELSGARAMIRKSDGTIDRRLLAEAKANLPNSRGRQFRQKMLSAMEAQLRAESGAAVPESEVKRGAERFIANIFDSKDSIDDKFSRLDNLISDTRRNLGGSTDGPGEWKTVSDTVRIRALD